MTLYRMILAAGIKLAPSALQLLEAVDSILGCSPEIRANVSAMM